MRSAAIALVAAALLPAVAAPDEETVDPAAIVFRYLLPGRTVTLTPSMTYGASLRRSEAEEGINAPPDGLILDDRSGRAELAARGLTLYRIPFGALPKGVEREESPRPPWLAVLETGLSAQPVFEQGAALKIPTDEVLVGLPPGTDLEKAKIFLKDVSQELGVRDLRLMRDGIFVLALKDATSGRSLEASRILTRTEGVRWAEPEFVSIFLETPGVLRTPPGGLRRVADIIGIRNLEKESGWKMLSRRERWPEDKDWGVLLDGSFESFVEDWSVGFRDGTLQVIPGVTRHRAHGHRNSIFMNLRELYGVRPPKHYPSGATTFLISPPFRLFPADQAFVEIWFWARLEDPGVLPDVDYDFGRIILVDEIWESQLEFPFLPLEGKRSHSGVLPLAPSFGYNG